MWIRFHCCLPLTSQTSGAAAEAAADRKTAKYAPLTQAFCSSRLQLKQLEPSTATVLNFWTTWEGASLRPKSLMSHDNHEKTFLCQRLFALIQHYNAVAILGTFALPTQPLRTRSNRSSLLVFNFCFQPLGSVAHYQGYLKMRIIIIILY